LLRLLSLKGFFFFPFFRTNFYCFLVMGFSPILVL
jgi:hypothetical protein